MYIDGITLRHITIANEDKTQHLYTIDHNYGGILSPSPHMTIAKRQNTANPNDAVIGTATLHSLKRTIEFECHGSPITMGSEGLFSHSFSFMSPAMGRQLYWETEGMWGADLVLASGQKEWVAKIDASLFSTSRFGKLHISDKVSDSAALDEIVIGGCAFVQYERRRRSRTSAGGGMASGGGY